jgi:hypothetical protein
MHISCDAIDIFVSETTLFVILDQEPIVPTGRVKSVRPIVWDSKPTWFFSLLPHHGYRLCLIDNRRWLVDHHPLVRARVSTMAKNPVSYRKKIVKSRCSKEFTIFQNTKPRLASRSPAGGRWVGEKKLKLPSVVVIQFVRCLFMKIMGTTCRGLRGDSVEQVDKEE